MTVSTAYSVLSFAGNDATTEFAVTWPFFTGSLVVTLVDSSGVETVQTITTHYTVSGGTDSNGLPATGTVTMLTAPATGETLRIQRSTPKTQAATWGENDAFPQKTIESAFDKLLLIAQEGGNAGTVNDGITGDVLSLVSSGATDYWDAESQIIRNVADPTADQDAVTKAYGDANYGGAAAAAASASASAASDSETAAAASALAASNSETAAGASETAAAASQSAAATSESNAATSESNALTYANTAQTAADAIGIRVTFSSSTTASDPGNGVFRFNNATPASATSIYIDNLDAAGATISGWIDSWDDVANSGARGTLVFRGVDDNADLLFANVTGSVVDSTGYRTVTITGVSGSGAFTDAEDYLILFSPAGADGAGSGDVVGPASSTNNGFAKFDGTSGKLLKDGAATVAIGSEVSGLGTGVATFLGTPTAANLNTAIGTTLKAVGKETIFIPAVAMTARTTNGSAAGTVETTTNKVMLSTLDFDATTIEYAQFAVRMPKSWNLGTVTASFTWSHPSTATNFGVVWALQGVAFGDSDAADAAFGTSVGVSDTGGTTDDVFISDETSAITIAGTPASQDWVVFQVWRNTGDGSDNMAVDARLHGVTLYFTTNASTDA